MEIMWNRKEVEICNKVVMDSERGVEERASGYLISIMNIATSFYI